MYTITKIDPTTAQEPVFCLQCSKPVILREGLALRVMGKNGASLGYLHPPCENSFSRGGKRDIAIKLTTSESAGHFTIHTIRGSGLDDSNRPFWLVGILYIQA
jgi:hypothetical protein